MFARMEDILRKCNLMIDLSHPIKDIEGSCRLSVQPSLWLNFILSKVLISLLKKLKNLLKNQLRFSFLLESL